MQVIPNEGGKTPGRYRILLFCLLFVLGPAVCAAKMVSIAGDEVNLRVSPTLRGAVKWVLGRGFPLQVIQSRGKWIKVRDFENDAGWVYAPLTSSVPHMVVKKKLVNIRSGPGEKYQVTGQASYGVVFRTLQQTGSWVKVKHETGKTGWVARRVLWGW